MAKDALGKELNVGDRVAFLDCDYRNGFQRMDEGIVNKLCEAMVHIVDTKKKHFKWTSSASEREVYRKYNRVIKL